VNNSAQLDRSFDALSHPARRAIVARLARGPATVGEASRTLGLSKPAVSKHLKVLEQAGLIERTVVGRTHRLGLRPRPLDRAERWLERHRQLWESQVDAVARHLDVE
jgi:DNA-binding transcriptional ArsR family regulator